MLNKEKIKQILAERFKNDTHTKLSLIPRPEALKDIQKAAKRIKKAIEFGEKVAIVGDYDVDGIVSSAILSEFFDDIGLEHNVKIPNRFTDGYGLNPNIVDNLDAHLIITVDNGICANDAAMVCEEKNIDLIITDHHCPPPILPKAYAIVNPKQIDCNFPADICGAEVAWYLCAAIKKELEISYSLDKFLDILCVAIISDMMELVDLNRTLVKEGLKRLNTTKRPCFLAIKEFFKKEVFDASVISFLIAPLLNSAGRMDDASISFNFIKSRSKKEADEYLSIVLNLNNARKDEERFVFEDAINQVNDDDLAVIVSSKNWHKGVLGIVASRLSRHFEKPSFVFFSDENGFSGSARSVANIDLLELLDDIDFCSIGGHSAAAGIKVEQGKFQLFKNAVNNKLKNISVAEFCDNEKVLGEIDVREIDMELGKILGFFEPFGQKNPRPYFLIKQAKITSKTIIKEKNLRLGFEKDGLCFNAMYFNFKTEPNIGQSVNLCVDITLNTYRGIQRVQIYVDEIY